MFLLDPLARLCVAALFLWSGLGKLLNLEETTNRVAAIRLPYVEAYPDLFINGALPYPQAFAAAAVLAELGGGALLVLGWRTRLASFGLAVFTICATLIYHRFWDFQGPEMQAQQIHFLKNVCVLGGLFLLMRHGPGALSVDGFATSSAAASREVPQRPIDSAPADA